MVHGKHCNWSLSTDKGVNLYDPETLTENNLSFLGLFTCYDRRCG